MTEQKGLIVIGSGGFSRTIIDAASELKMTVEGVIDFTAFAQHFESNLASKGVLDNI